MISELFYRNLIANSLDGILVTDEKGLIRFASTSTHRILGYDDQEIIGKAEHHEVVTILSAPNDQWSLIKTDKGEEGYVYTQYLTSQ